MLNILVLALILISVLVCFGNCQECELLVLPLPSFCTRGQFTVEIARPCSSLIYNFNVSSQPHIVEILNYYHQKNFGCLSLASAFFDSSLQNIRSVGAAALFVKIQIQDSLLKNTYTLEEESYVLSITNSGMTSIVTKSYAGFLRGLETFMQLLHKNQDQRVWKISDLPIQITDKPEYSYRGIMIDTARHFLPLKTIFETVDAMMYNKMNVLHWHISDHQSFPLNFTSHPQLLNAYDDESVYSHSDVKTLVNYALVRGVRVIPEINVPSRAGSWNSSTYHLCKQNGSLGYQHALDITNYKNVQTIKDIIKELSELFIDENIHLGGDQLEILCYDNRTDYIHKENIPNIPDSIQLHFFNKLREFTKSVGRKPIFWKQNVNLITTPQDTVHWMAENLPTMKIPAPVIMTFQYEYNLGMGMSEQAPYNNGRHWNWADLHWKNIRMEQERLKEIGNSIIGAQVILESWTSNSYTHHIYLWMRTSAMAERVWNTNGNDHHVAVLRRLTRFQRTLNRRGIPTAPATCQQCETNDFC